MTRRSIPYPCLQAELERRMHPESRKRPSLAIQALWGWLTFLTGLGMVLGFMFGLVFILPVVAVFRRVRR